jgi:hypothetical protein
MAKDATLGGRGYPCPSAAIGISKSVSSFAALAHPSLRFNKVTLPRAEFSILGDNTFADGALVAIHQSPTIKCAWVVLVGIINL